MSDVQARPDELSSFHSTETAAATQLESDRDSLDDTFIAFRTAPGGGCAAQGDAVVGQAMTALIAELREIPGWVKLVNDAVLAADHTSDNGLVSVNAVAFNSALQALAAERNIDITDLATSNQISVLPPQVGTVPQDSGYVNDPVCTATGHLLVDSRDFAMPARLDVVSFRRTYASQSMRPSAFGPGWWTWTECRAEVDAAGSFHYVGPDALQLSIAAVGAARGWSRADLDLLVERPDADTQVLRWGRRSRNPNQHWTFHHGLLVEVAGPFIGSTSFDYRARRLTRLEHDSGRALTLRWKGDRVVAITSSDGRRASFTYNPVGALVAVDTARSAENYEVDASGRILSITDADGIRTVAMAYDDEGRVVEQTSATGFTTRFDYGAVRRTTLSDPDYNPLSVYTHDEHGRVEMYATGGGFRFTRRFDGLGRVVSQGDPDGRSFTLVDSTAGPNRSEEVRWSSGDVERYDYDYLDRLVRQFSNTSTTEFSYAGDAVFPARIEVVGQQGLAVDLDWQFGTPARIVDSDGVSDTITVRADGTIAAATNGVGDTTRYDVDPSGAVVAVHHPDGRVVGYERDDAGRLTAVVNAAGQRGQIRYTAAGRIQSCVDADGAVTAVEYDAAGLPRRLVAADGIATDLLFDDKQRIVGARFANGDAIGLELDEFGRQLAVDINDDRWVAARDAAGRIVERTDPTGQQLAQEYGALGGWMQITDAAGQSWRMERDLVNRVRTLTTPEGSQFTAAFMPEGLLASQTTPDGREETYRYTPAGRLAEVTDGSSMLRYRYDAAGRIVGTDAGTGWWTFDLDAAGRITRRVSPAGREQRYDYNVLGQLVALVAGGSTWRFTYDTAGRLTRSVDPTGCSSRFGYDVAGRMVESADSLGTAVRYGYDVRGRVAALTDAHGGAVSYEHDAVNQLTSITDQLGRQTIVTYDAAGRHVATTYCDQRSDGPPAQTSSQLVACDPSPVVFTDDVQPLTSATSADGIFTTWALPGGDRIELVRDADLLPLRLSSPGFVRTWTHDAWARVITVVDERDGIVATTSLLRDAAGRVVQQDVDSDLTTYRYDVAGQLVGMSDAGGASSWEYDQLGRLVIERTPGGERRFAYDDAHQLVELTDAAGTTRYDYDVRGRRIRARGDVDITYVWGESRLEAVVTDGVVRRFQTDSDGALRRAGGITVDWDTGRGPARPAAINGEQVVTVDCGAFATVDDDSTVSWRRFELADAWGDSTDRQGGWHPYFGPVAEGVVWLGARPYDVATRQFLAPDPLAPIPGKPGSTSPYTYAANDPINLFDPTGRQPISIAAFNDIRDRRTGAQWQNIASVAIAAAAVVVTVATLGTAGPVAMVLGGAAIGALAGAASGATREGLEEGMNLGDGEFNGETIIRDTVVGGLGGALGGGLGAGANALTTSTRLAGNTGVRLLGTRGGSAFSEGVSGASEGLLAETYDVAMPATWGADGRWDNGSIVESTLISAGAGGALHNVGAPAHGGVDVPTSGSADPNTVNSPDSPAPDLPRPTPASASADTAAANAGDSPDPTTTADSGPATDSADVPAADMPDTPQVAETPDVADAPEGADTPQVAETPDVADTTSETPQVAETPEVADTPDGAETPDVVEVGDTPDAAETPDVVEVGDTPDAAETPDTPDAAEVADTPDTAETPDNPDPPGVGSAADGDSERVYTVGGADHATAAAPEQLTGAPTAQSAVDAALADADLFARHGIDEPWTRQQLIDVVHTDTADLTPAQREVLVEIRNQMPQPQAGEWIQKVIRPDQVDTYLGNVSDGRYGPNTIGGSMTRAVDTAHLGTPDGLHDALRLDYSGTVFHQGDASVHVIRFQTDDTSGFVTPRHTRMGGDGNFDGWSDPFTGNGYTKAGDDVIPEHHGTMTMENGAEMWEILDTGTQRLAAVLQGGQWVPVG